MDLPVFAKKGGIAPIGVFNELWCTPAIAATCGMCFKIKVQPGWESARCKRDGFFAHPECPGTVDEDHSYADHPGMEWAFNYAVYYDDPDGIPYIIGMNVEYVVEDGASCCVHRGVARAALGWMQIAHSGGVFTGALLLCWRQLLTGLGLFVLPLCGSVLCALDDCLCDDSLCSCSTGGTTTARSPTTR